MHEFKTQNRFRDKFAPCHQMIGKRGIDKSGEKQDDTLNLRLITKVMDWKKEKKKNISNLHNTGHTQICLKKTIEQTSQSILGS